MFGFPIGNGNVGFDDFLEKFTNNADSGFPKIQQREVFYSVRDGQWFDRGTWQTASGRVGLLPTRNDDVYVRHNVNVDWGLVGYANIAIEVNNVIVSREGKFSNGPGSGYQFRVFGDFKYYGIYDSVTTGGWDLYGVNNYIDKSRQSTKIYINYQRIGDQNMMDALYGHVSALGAGFKYSTSDMIVDNMFSNTSAACFYIRNPHSLVCNGTFNCYWFYSDTEYNLTFKGSVASLYLFFCSRNPTIEFQNNIAFNQGNYGGTIIDKIPFTSSQFVLPLPYGSFQSMYFGTGLVKFTTNNIQINNTGTIYLDNNFLIDPNIVVTNNTGSNMYIHGTWNGSNGASQLINKGGIYFNSLASISSMTTGIFDYTTFANTIGFTGNYTTTIPSYFTTFHNLTISGTGTKSLGVNTTLNGNLLCNGNGGFFNTSTFTLSVNGTSLIQNYCTLQNTGGGNLLFVGLLRFGVSFTDRGFINFPGNPNVELRGGVEFNTGYDYIFECGTGTWSFTTNNQIIRSMWYYSGRVKLYNVLIVGNITLTYFVPTGLETSNAIEIQNTLNGTTASSTFLLGNGAMFFINTTNNIMTTGIFDCTTNNCSVGYSGSVNQTIQFSNFRNLLIDGNGTKTLSANTTISGNINIGQYAITPTFDSSIYTLSVGGTTTIHWGTLSNTGGGAMTFTGLLSFGTAFTSQSYINFSGNPNVECRGGARFYRGYGTIFDCGTGTWTFTTNNQIISHYGAMGGYVQMRNILISGAITLTYNNLYPGSDLRVTNSINGDNVNSKFLCGADTIFYNNGATQPMATGILDTSTNLNTWIYGSGNQDIKGNTYRNLTLNGGGTKTLQGNVSVQNTYTLTAPATVNLNGFTLTNP